MLTLRNLDQLRDHVRDPDLVRSQNRNQNPALDPDRVHWCQHPRKASIFSDSIVSIIRIVSVVELLGRRNGMDNQVIVYTYRH